MNIFSKHKDVIPAKAGILNDKDSEDPGFRRDDDMGPVYAYYPLG